MGTLQLEAETPDCVLDMSVSPWQLSSTNLLQTRSGDSNFYVEGVGFFWNNVSSGTRGSPTACTPSSVGGRARGQNQYHAHADRRFTRPRHVLTPNSVVTYRDHVEVMNPQIKLTSAFLTARMTQGGTNNQVDRIVAPNTSSWISSTTAAARPTRRATKAVFTQTNGTRHQQIPDPHRQSEAGNLERLVHRGYFCFEPDRPHNPGQRGIVVSTAAPRWQRLVAPPPKLSGNRNHSRKISTTTQKSGLAI